MITVDIEGVIMAYRNKFFLSFDYNSDVHYYWLMRAWRQDDGTKFNFYNTHDMNMSNNTNLELPIRQVLKNQLLQTKAFVILVGEKTRYLQYVHWEIEEALELHLPIICVNLNGFRHRDPIRCPSIISERLSVDINFDAVVLQHALETWPTRHNNLKQQGYSSPYYYTQNDYVRLGLGPSARDEQIQRRTKEEKGFLKKVPRWRSRLRLHNTEKL